MTGLDVLLAAGFGVSMLGIGYLAIKREPDTNAPRETPLEHGGKAVSACPPGFLPAMNAEGLFRAVGAQPLLTRIHQSLGFAPENEIRDVMPLLKHVAEFVQLLPASESHHHANPGGLLTHVLEVAAVALLRCEEAKLPLGRPTEEQLKHAARWRYAVFVAALLHDIGKPIADVEVTVLTDKGATKAWNGLGGSIGDFGRAYLVGFPMRKDYLAHQRLPVMLLKSMVPASTMKWLSDDTELVPALIAYLSGASDGGIIGRLVKDADQKSVADNLLKGCRTRFMSSRHVPLIERSMDAIRRMLADGGELPLNREGAIGYCDGADLWFVAGALADKVRTYLDRNEIREEGAAGIPTDNSRLFDVWLDFGAVVPNAGNAIWRARVTLDRTDGPAWRQVFTLLRFPLDKLFPSRDHYPAILTGSIEIVVHPAVAAGSSVSASSLPEAEPVARVLEGGAVLPEPAPNPGADLTMAAEAVPEAGELGAVEVDFDLPSPAEPGTPVPILAPTTDANSADEFLDPADCALSALAPAEPRPTAGPARVARVLTAPVAPAGPQLPKDSVAGAAPAPDPAVDAFMAWIQRGVADGSVPYNRNTASVHFVREGLFLLTPKVFREYLGLDNAGDRVAADPNGAAVKRLQKLLQRSGYVVKNQPNSYLHPYRVTNAKNVTREIVTGYLAPHPEVFFNPVPAPNEVLERTNPQSP